MTKLLPILKLFITILSLLLSIQLHAAGLYDGIYIIDNSSHYVSVHENSTTNQMVVMVVNAEPSNNSWLALIGTRSVNSVMVASIAGVSDTDIAMNATVNFDNVGNATVMVNSCVDGVLYYCRFPTGATFTISKIF